MTTIIFKIFYEKTDEDYEKYNKLWDEHRERMIFLQDHLPFLKQARCFRDDISDNKDILSIRFPTRKFFTRNKIFNNIISGKGFIIAIIGYGTQKKFGFTVHCLIKSFQI